MSSPPVPALPPTVPLLENHILPQIQARVQDPKVYVFGRLRGVTMRRIEQLARAAGYVLTLVLAHGKARAWCRNRANFACVLPAQLDPLLSARLIDQVFLQVILLESRKKTFPTFQLTPFSAMRSPQPSRSQISNGRLA